MPTLLIDTSTERAVVAFEKDGELIFQEELPVGLQNSKHLFPALYAGLEQTKLRLQDFTLIAVGIGPGSYTGIRVGAAAAQTMAYALDIPIVGVCSLIGFIPKTNGSFAALIDAKQGGVYTLFGEKTQQGISYNSNPSVHSIEEATDLCKNCEWLVTPFSQPLQKRFAESQSTQWCEQHPCSVQMIKQAKDIHAASPAQSYKKLDLLYLKEWQSHPN